MFVLKQGWACLFGGLMTGGLLISDAIWQETWALARYDALLIYGLLIQAAFLALKLASWREARVILLFRINGTAMEVFKVNTGSWAYPEPGLIKLFGVAAVFWVHVCQRRVLHGARHSNFRHAVRALSAVLDYGCAGQRGLSQFLCAPLCLGHARGAIRRHDFYLRPHPYLVSDRCARLLDAFAPCGTPHQLFPVDR